jgi:hypothetical protein
MPAAKPSTDTQLLTEIRDLLKEQQAATQATQLQLKHTHQVQVAMLCVKILFYGVTIAFTIYGALYYASTMLSLTTM